jgi:hypothetical protein
MAYRIGIDVGSTTTTWATVSRDDGTPERVDGGSVESVAGLIDGALVVGAEASDASRLQESTRGFVDRLGESDAIILGGTPYGAETLVGRLIASVVATASGRLGSAPGAVVIVHDDSLDEFRVGLLTEAARVAGVPMADVVMVSRSAARAAAPSAAAAGLETVAGASMLGWVHRPAPTTAAGATGIGATEVGIAATGAAAGAAGTAAVAAGLGDGVAHASAAMAPPVAPAGPAGTPLSAPTGAGPAGSPLSPPAGAPGTPITAPAGPAGTPLTPPAGPTGTPVTPTAGPTGTSLPGPAAATEGTPIAPTTGSSGISRAITRPRRLPIIVGASVAAVAVVAVVAVAINNDDTPSTAPAATTLVVESTAPNGSDPTDTTAAIDTTVPIAATASRCVQGQWTMRNQTFADFFSSMMAGAAGGEIVATGVSGAVSIEVAEDGTWTIDYDAWTINASLPTVGGEMSVTIDGVDVSNGTFNDDGTYSFSGVSMGSTMTSTARVNGVDVPIPPVDRTSQTIGGIGSFTCAGDTLELTVPESGGSFIMDRTG